MVSNKNNIEKCLQIAKDLHLNLGFIGAHGRAKTAMVQQYADSLGYTLITKILSCLEPTDMIGLPVSETKNNQLVTRNAYPNWLVDACNPKKKVILFFDEFNNAEKDVQSSILNLIEDRKLDDMELAETTQIVVAFNPISIAPNARKLSKATRDRLCIIPISDDKKPFKDYYSKNNMDVLNMVLDELNPIKCYDEEVTNEAYENAELTYRSLEKVYNICKYCVDNKIDSNIGIMLSMGYGGKNSREVYFYIEEKLKGEISSINYIDFISKLSTSLNRKEITTHEGLKLFKDFIDHNYSTNLNVAKCIQLIEILYKDFNNATVATTYIEATFGKEILQAYKQSKRV